MSNERYEDYRSERIEHLGDIGFADAIEEVMRFERWIIRLKNASSKDRNEMIDDEYRKIIDRIDDYEWDRTFKEEED